ncbi:Uncharacterized protein APZ42_031682 [Daphnia magna]|uniref:Uncharacterized protein n=1 Tax=Daphnia magna TaxID=35525 RepID=A0A164MJE2_9CRUS|nr:Uncharacterized protein APZ42_031682 [Daphnia magna]
MRRSSVCSHAESPALHCLSLKIILYYISVAHVCSFPFRECFASYRVCLIESVTLYIFF